MLTRNCTEMSADGIRTCEPCSESQILLLPEAGEGYKGSQMEVLATIKMYDLYDFNDDEDMAIETVVP
jgi:hypothetical protein